MNPEFKRYVWLELTPHRLIATSLILGVFFFTLIRYAPGDMAEAMSLIAYIALVIFWGSKQASESVIDEFNENTWDNQRMSSLSPWRMTWAKIFGSTVYAWFTGLICLLVYLFNSSEIHSFNSQLMNTFSLILFAIAVQSISMIGGVMTAHSQRNNRNHWLIILLMLFVGLSILTSLTDNEELVSWYNIDFIWTEFFFISILMWAAWAVFGAYRLMRRELQFRNGPIPWLVFLVWLAIYITGFVETGEEPVSLFAMQSFVVFITMLGLCYILLFIEPLDLIDLRRLVLTKPLMGKKHIWSLLPLWVITLAVTVVAGLIAIWAIPFNDGETMTSLFPLILLLFLLRDGAIILSLRISKHHKRAGMAAMIYLLVLYGMSNWLIEMTGLEVLQPLFTPLPKLGVIGAVLPPLIMTITFISIFIYQFKKRILYAEKNDS